MTALSKATITIKKIFDNGQGKPSKIIDTQERQWKIWHDVLEQLNLKEGSAYDIGYAEGEYKGKPDNTIRAASAAVATNGHAQTTSAYAQIVGPIEIITTNPAASVFGMVNAYISIGAVAADKDAGANLIDKCEDMFLNSRIGKRTLGR